MTPVNQGPLNLLAAAPEMILAIGALALLMFGVFRQDQARATLILWLTIALLVLAGIVAFIGDTDVQYAFGGVFVSDGVSRFAKVFIFFGTAVTLLLSRAYLVRANLMIFEFPVLVALAALGMAMMVSAADLISLYMGLELQSLALYVLASFRRDSVKSTEAGLKYFVLGALSSGLLLFGSSFVYGAAVSTEFSRIAESWRPVARMWAWSSGWLSSSRALPSRFPPPLSICGRPTSTRVRRRL